MEPEAHGPRSLVDTLEEALSIARQREMEAAIERSPRVLRLVVTQQPASAGYGDTPDAETIYHVVGSSEEPSQFLAVPVSGNCLEPDIPAGVIAIVDRDRVPLDGDPVLASHEGEHVFKYLERRGEEAWLVANQDREPIRVNGETLILGVVISWQKRAERRRR
jgi:SOS-response transcriptional repressor LexA